MAPKAIVLYLFNMIFTPIGHSLDAITHGGFLAAALVFHAIVPRTADVSYFLVADGRILDGAVPYVDILETNPPLAFWITLPAVWLARIWAFRRILPLSALFAWPSPGPCA